MMHESITCVLHPQGVNTFEIIGSVGATALSISPPKAPKAPEARSPKERVTIGWQVSHGV